MITQNHTQGTWIHRLAIRLFTIIFALLVYWLLDFLVEDVESLEGPNYEDIEARHVDQNLLQQLEQRRDASVEIDLAIERKREEMRLLDDGSRNLQNTINQLIELQRLAIQKSIDLPNDEQSTLSTTLTHFLEGQRQYQRYNNELAKLAEQKRQLELEKTNLEEQVEQQRAPAQAEFSTLNEQHAMHLAYLQLLVLLPLLVIAALLIMRGRSSIYLPIFLGYSAATLLKILLLIHHYFPFRYVKYLLIFGMILVVSKLLVYFIRMVAFPKAEWLMRQYREAYESFLCPMCEYPIRTGPRQYLFWTRHTVNKVVLPKESPEAKPYTCPVCGTALFAICDDCHGIRHALLPHCQHCGAKR